MNYEQLTDEQLNKEVAEKVMGFKAIKFGAVYFLRGPDGNEIVITVNDWQPTTSIAQAKEVLDKMIADGWEFGFHLSKGVNEVWVYPEEYYALTSDKSLSRAICISALRAVNSKDEL